MDRQAAKSADLLADGKGLVEGAGWQLKGLGWAVCGGHEPQVKDLQRA